MAQTRKDLRGRVLRKGESQRRSDERYVYTYTDPLGRRKYVYAQDLVTLREKEAQLMKDCFVIEAIKERFEIPVSLDTYKYQVAQAGILAGADLINDIWGFKWDDEMAPLCAKYQIPVCLMHNRKEAVYNDFIADVIADMKECVQIARASGLADDKIILDPGIGFAKTTEENLKFMNHLEDLVALGYPVLLGTSRKSMIGNTLNLPVDEREEGTMATSVLGLVKGCSFFRVHDVKKNVRALAMTDAMLKA